MPKIADILADRTKFPDDTVIEFADGEKFTAKEIRDTYIPKGEFTRFAQDNATKRQEMEATINGLTQQLAQAVEAKAAGASPAEAKRMRKMTLEELVDDPVLGGIAEAIQALARNQAQAIDGYRLERAKERVDALGYTDPERRKSFLDYARSAETDLLGMAHKAFTADDAIKKAREEAMAEGERKGREAAKLTVPTGGRRPGVTKPKDAPGFLDMGAADQDPELLAIVNGETP